MSKPACKSVVFLIDSLKGGGAERVIAELANHFCTLDCHVSVVTFSRQEQGEYPLATDVTRVALGLKTSSLPKSRFGKLSAVLINVKRILAVRKVFTKADSSTVAISFMGRMNVTLLLATIGYNTKCIVCERNKASNAEKSQLWEWLRRRSYGSAESVVVQTEWSKSWLLENSHANNIQVIPNFISQAKIEDSHQSRSDLNLNRNFILAAGRDDKQKGFDRLLDIYSKIAPLHENLDLLIAGPDVNSEYAKQAAELGLAKRVHFLGRVANMVDLYCNAKIFVLTSRYEGFPNVLLEAMAEGCAVVSFDIETGPSDIIDNGRTGILVADGDLRGFADALNKLLDNDSLRFSIGDAALEVKQKYSKEKIMVQWENLVFDQYTVL